MKKREPSYTIDGNVNWHSHCGEQYGGSSKKLKLELPYDPAIPLLGLYRENTKTLIQKHIHPSVHSGTIYNSQDMETAHQQLICLRRCGIYNINRYMMEYYSAIEKNEMLPFAAT